MKIAMFIVCVFNVVDGIVTYIGLQNGLISESNPMMRSLYTFNPNLFLLSKLLLSFMLLLILFVPLKKTMLLERITFLAVIMYGFVLSLHTIWIFS
ncbi:hypothetical protein EJF36_03295 [Bacillus sp. HMF5848]|uniref:DUF5658 family protein n=1 Tax=Bacillus sp. HMF5848 TaxID=2495421 RepID=UPI000F774F67|nr:DUF5658 family protein [Bacillus sp. HMF5848]RSK26001.1 hypothetical protein EJF36_03295 [Bacillus sp. HMF5848]